MDWQTYPNQVRRMRTEVGSEDTIFVYTRDGQCFYRDMDTRVDGPWEFSSGGVTLAAVCSHFGRFPSKCPIFEKSSKRLARVGNAMRTPNLCSRNVGQRFTFQNGGNKYYGYKLIVFGEGWDEGYKRIYPRVNKTGGGRYTFYLHGEYGADYPPLSPSHVVVLPYKSSWTGYGFRIRVSSRENWNCTFTYENIFDWVFGLRNPTFGTIIDTHYNPGGYFDPGWV